MDLKMALIEPSKQFDEELLYVEEFDKDEGYHEREKRAVTEEDDELGSGTYEATLTTFTSTTTTDSTATTATVTTTTTTTTTTATTTATTTTTTTTTTKTTTTTTTTTTITSTTTTTTTTAAAAAAVADSSSTLITILIVVLAIVGLLLFVSAGFIIAALIQRILAGSRMIHPILPTTNSPVQVSSAPQTQSPSQPTQQQRKRISPPNSRTLVYPAPRPIAANGLTQVEI